MNSILKAQWNYHSYLSTVVYFIGPGNFKDVDFISESSGMFCFDKWLSPSSGTRVIIKATTGLGSTWSEIYSEQGGGYNSYSIKAVRNQETYYHIKSGGGYYIIDKTIDQGNSWLKTAQFDGFYYDFSVIDTAHFFVLKKVFWSNKYFIDKYENGLRICIDSFAIEKPRQLFFTDTSTGFLIASDLQYTNTYLVLKSVTGGNNWMQIFADSSLNINQIYFPSSDVGYAVCDSGKIIRTTDAGSSWQYLNSNTTLNLKCTNFINDSIGYAAGDSGLIIKTIDAGLSWQKQITDTSLSFNKIFFVNDSVGFALAGQTLYKTRQSPLFVTVNNISAAEDYLIYPNPTSGLSYIETNDSKTSIEVINILGERVYYSRSNIGRIEIDLRNVKDGLYFIRLLKENSIIAQCKIIIKK